MKFYDRILRCSSLKVEFDRAKNVAIERGAVGARGFWQRVGSKRSVLLHEVSSDPSTQSKKKSQRRSSLMQLPSSHRNWPGKHWLSPEARQNSCIAKNKKCKKTLYKNMRGSRHRLS